jgi:hypothetical protein
MNIRQISFPLLLIIFGLGLLIFSFVDGQNIYFKIGCFALLVVGVVSAANGLGLVSKSNRMVLVAILGVIALVVAALDFKSIKDPIDFGKERDKRYAQVIQRLKDIRQAQLSFRQAKGVYANDFDELFNFLKNDSLLVIKAIGVVPDTLTEQEALDLGIITRDTIYEPTYPNVYTDAYLADRVFPFILDSIAYVPFTNGVKFKMEAGSINRGKVSVPTFQVTDAQPFDKNKVLQVGNVNEPTTSGNWE